MEHFLATCILSSLAYQQPVDIENELNKAGFKDFQFINNDVTNTQAFLCSQDESVFLSFRGTQFDSWDDWMTNLNCGFVPCAFGQGHAGFFGDVNSVYDEILQALPKHIIKQRKLTITGHSQGAGDAMAMGVKMLGEHRAVSQVIHYGGPRTVDVAAAEHIDKYFPGIFRRVVNNNDIVTRIPPRISGYCHFGDLDYFTEDGLYTRDPSFWSRFLDRIYGKLKDIGELHLDCIKDHMIDSEYLRLVTQTVNR